MCHGDFCNPRCIQTQTVKGTEEHANYFVNDFVKRDEKMPQNAIRFYPSRTFEGKRRNKSLKEVS